jgi:hypothetical protein
MMMMRQINVRLQFERLVTQKETGFVLVSVPITSSIDDAIAEAEKGNFLRKLVMNIEPLEEEWTFRLPEQQDSGA